MPQVPQENLDTAVAVLVSEDFFRNRICTTLIAVGHEATVLEVGVDFVEFQERVLHATTLGLVIDLEEEGFDALALLSALMADERTADWILMAYCSYDRKDLLEAAAKIGVEVVLRSTFASNLVRLLQGFSAPQGRN
jgi:hypothetical protein